MTVLRTEQRHTSLASRMIDTIRQGIEIYGWTAVMMDGARCHNDTIRQGIEIYGWTAVMMDGARCHNAQMMNEADRHLQKVIR